MELVPMAEFTIVTRSSSSAWIPELIATAGPEVTETYIDFFTATIRNRNTRAAYARACWQLFDWCTAHGLELTTVLVVAFAGVPGRVMPDEHEAGTGQLG